MDICICIIQAQYIIGLAFLAWPAYNLYGFINYDSEPLGSGRIKLELSGYPTIRDYYLYLYMPELINGDYVLALSLRRNLSE